MPIGYLCGDVENAGGYRRLELGEIYVGDTNSHPGTEGTYIRETK